MMATTLITASTPRLIIRQHARRSAALATTTKRTLTTAADAAQQMLRAFEGQTRTSRQVLDGHQLQKLSLTLGRKHLHHPGGWGLGLGLGLDDDDDTNNNLTARPPPRGTPLPPGYHLVFFSPAAIEADLGADGTDRTFNAPAPFSRRMWAGGRMSWRPPPRTAEGGSPSAPSAPPPMPLPLLRVGDEVEERTRLVGATAKRSRRTGGDGGDGGDEMVLVEVEKEFWGPAGLALVDRRSWVFRPPPREAVLARREEDVAGFVPGAVGRYSSVEDVQVDGSDVPHRKFQWSPVALFRFSALTFNAHMIHYNESWTRNVEGHPAVVVHGPLNLIAMLDYWRDVHGNGQEPAEISYRALSPLYAGDEYVVRTESVKDVEMGETCWELVVAKGDKICMKGSITA